MLEEVRVVRRAEAEPERVAWERRGHGRGERKDITDTAACPIVRREDLATDVRRSIGREDVSEDRGRATPAQTERVGIPSAGRGRPRAPGREVS